MADGTVFVYTGRDRQRRRVRGEISGSDANTARNQLRKQGIVPIRLRKRASAGGRFSFGGNPGPAEIALFTRQMATMMKAGVPLVQSFDIVAEGTDKPKLRDLIQEIRKDVSAGNSFTAAIQRHPRYFDDLFCNLIHAGEQSGTLETMLDRVATYRERTEALKGRVRSALVYPLSVMAIAGVVAGILLIHVVPQFEAIFVGFGAELPAYTQFVVNLSEGLQRWWPVVPATAIGAVLAGRETLRRSPAMRHRCDRVSLRVPIAGSIIRKAAIARFARTLATTFAAGVPLVEALASVAGATGNSVFRSAILRVREDVSAGQQLNHAMGATGVFPAMVLQMTRIGEESGALDEMLDKAATYFEDQVNNAVNGLTMLLEPVIMAVLGVLVGGLLVAMYLPIFSIGAVIGG